MLSDAPPPCISLPAASVGSRSGDGPGAFDIGEEWERGTSSEQWDSTSSSSVGYGIHDERAANSSDPGVESGSEFGPGSELGPDSEFSCALSVPTSPPRAAWWCDGIDPMLSRRSEQDFEVHMASSLAAARSSMVAPPTPAAPPMEWQSPGSIKTESQGGTEQQLTGVADLVGVSDFRAGQHPPSALNAGVMPAQSNRMPPRQPRPAAAPWHASSLPQRQAGNVQDQRTLPPLSRISPIQH